MLHSVAIDLHFAVAFASIPLQYLPARKVQSEKKNCQVLVEVRARDKEKRSSHRQRKTSERTETNKKMQ